MRSQGLWIILTAFCVMSAPAIADRTAEFEAQRAALAEGDNEGRYRLAEWATKRGMKSEADALYRAVLASEPGHDGAYRAIWRLADRGSLGVDSKALTQAEQSVGRGFRRSETAHYVVLSSAGQAWTREQRSRLERAYTQFMRVSRDLGLNPLPLRHKLVCVLFRDKPAFERFARTHDNMRSGWSYGYYAPARDRVVLFNGEREKGADDFAKKRTLATTVHEAIHQLHFHTSVQNKHVQYPLWINEGLATAYETDAPRGDFGPDHEFAPRLERLAEVLQRGEQIPLRVLVQLDKVPAAARDVRAMYCQSYALVSWLATERSAELGTYLALMRAEPPGRPRPKRYAALFEAAFGDIASLEKAWLADQHARVASLKRATGVLTRASSSH